MRRKVENSMDIKTKLKEIYIKNPYIRLVPYSFIVWLKYGKEYRKYYKFLRKSETWDKKKMKQWQFRQLKEIVRYSYQHVPYYKKLYDMTGFHPDDLRTFKDFEKIPTVCKDDIKEHPKEFLSDEIEKIYFSETHSSGTISEPLTFYLDKQTDIKDMIFHQYNWEKLGYHIGEKCLVVRGIFVAEPKKEKFHQYNKVWNWLILDPCYLEEDKYFPIYEEQIKKFGAKILFAYPSLAYMLAKAYIRNQKKPPKFRMIILSSENIIEGQLRFIKKVFQCHIVTYNYGHSEHALMASNYKEKTFLGFFPQYGYMELLDENKKCIKKDGIIGEITGTSFGKAMPLIRYRTQDYTSYARHQSTDYMKLCTSVNRIEGRKQDFVITSEGKAVSLLVITTGDPLEEMLCEFDEMQYEQKEIGKLIVYGKENKRHPVTNENINLICRLIERNANNKLEVTYKKTNKIEKTHSYKKRSLIQHVNFNEYGKENE